VSISDLGSLGEFIGSIAVLVTLIYVALQIRYNTHATRAASHHAITDALMRTDMHVCDTMYYQAQVGAGDDGLWQAEQRYLGTILTNRGGGQWLRENSLSISAGFGSAIKEIVQRYQAAESDLPGRLEVRYGVSP